MAYTTVTGGQEAIEQSHQLVDFYRLAKAEQPLRIEEIQSQMRLLIDKVMSESSLYIPQYAALAIKQAQGDPAEAVFLLCAYRSTLPRNHYSNLTMTSDMRVIRRISSSFKDIPGGQVLGPTYDYMHRLLNFALLDEDAKRMAEVLESVMDASSETGQTPTVRKTVDLLREQQLMAALGDTVENVEPFDVTREKVQFPAPRSAKLQMLARGETGVMTAFAYSSMRGYGAVHPTIAELRVGYQPISIPHPYGADDEDAIYIGEVLLTEVETINSFTKSADDKVQFSLGYGLCFGQNEVKAISMAILERSLELPGPSPTQDEEFVLLHIDSLEANGFVSHLKLPHYTTFQASLDRIRSVQDTVTARSNEEEEDSYESSERVEEPVS